MSNGNILSHLLRHGRWSIDETDGGGMRACVRLARRDGEPLILCASMNGAIVSQIERQARRAIEQNPALGVLLQASPRVRRMIRHHPALGHLLGRIIQARQQDGASAGAFSWPAAGRLARKIARARLMRKLLNGAHAVLQNPTIAKAVGIAAVVIPVYGQAFGAAYMAARTADTALRRARTDPRAREQLAQMAARAAAGDQGAERAMQAMRAVSTARRTAQSMQAARAAGRAASGYAGVVDSYGHSTEIERSPMAPQSRVSGSGWYADGMRAQLARVSGGPLLFSVSHEG